MFFRMRISDEGLFRNEQTVVLREATSRPFSCRVPTYNLTTLITANEGETLTLSVHNCLGGHSNLNAMLYLRLSFMGKLTLHELCMAAVSLTMTLDYTAEKPLDVCLGVHLSSH